MKKDLIIQKKSCFLFLYLSSSIPGGSIKSPDPVLRSILRHCGVLLCTLIPLEFFASCEDAKSQLLGSGPGLRALPANFLHDH
jgi:hypothetical protein